MPVARRFPDGARNVTEPRLQELADSLIVRGTRLLVWTITAFTLAHSITLALATLGVVHVPGPPVEAAIALSILLLACEIVRLQRGEDSLTARWPWLVAFSFGLLHGLGFAGALAKRIRLAGSLERYTRPAASYAIGILASFWFFERLAGFWM